MQYFYGKKTYFLEHLLKKYSKIEFSIYQNQVFHNRVFTVLNKHIQQKQTKSIVNSMKRIWKYKPVSIHLYLVIWHLNRLQGANYSDFLDLLQLKKVSKLSMLESYEWSQWCISREISRLHSGRHYPICNGFAQTFKLHSKFTDLTLL